MNSNTATKGWMIFTQALMVLSLLPWAAALMMSPMASTAGPNTFQNLLTVLLAYPVVLLVCAVTSWLVFRKGHLLVAAILTSIPFVFVFAVARFI